MSVLNPNVDLRSATRFLRFPDFGNLQWLHARFKNQKFAPHYHDGHVIGMIEDGALGFNYLGESVVAAPGQINIADPGEVHNGFAKSDAGWQYRMFYLSQGQLNSMCRGINGEKYVQPYFGAGVITDEDLAQKLRQLHFDFAQDQISWLEKESRFLGLMIQLVSRYTKSLPINLPSGREDGSVKIMKCYIQEHYHTDIRLSDLAQVSGLSKYYLLRAFAKKTGLTPHAYLTLVRAYRARQKLNQGAPIITAAHETGFFDQSHLNRVFKKVYGITPGQYCSCVVYN